MEKDIIETKNSLKMGFAEVDITPSHRVETIGFGREDNMSRGVLKPLAAQVSVWQCGSECCCLTTIDHIGFSKEHGDCLRSMIGEELGIDVQKVMLCFSHGHSCPNESASVEYFDFLCSRVKKAAGEAAGNLVQVRAGWSNAIVDIGLNRRGSGGALDRRAGIFKVCEAGSDKVKLLLFRLTAHCNVLKADNYLISPDYFGAVRDRFREEYGCPVMVVQGAAGNVAPKFFKSELNPPDAADERFIRSDHALEEMAEEVFSRGKPVIESMKMQPEAMLSMYSRRITLTAQVPSMAEAEAIAADAEHYCGIDGTAWIEEVRRLRADGVEEQMEEIEVQYFYLSNGCLCGVANEVMVEFALHIEKSLRNEMFYFNGYTNGCTGYFPTEEEFDLGGYEVYWSMVIYYIYHGRVYPLKRESASRLMDFVVEHSMAG